MKNVQKSDKTPYDVTCIECGKSFRKVMNTKLQWMQENISFKGILQNIMAVTCKECGKPLKKVMSTKLQWMEETCIEGKESQETSYAIPCALHEKSDFFEKEYKKT